MKPALVVGAGLSGLATAWTLAATGRDVAIVDAADGPGGLIGTIKTSHGLVERAANAFVWTDVTERWFAALGITPQFPKPDAKRRYVFTRGRARRWPLSASETATLAMKIAASAARRRLKPQSGETIAQFGDRVAGRGVTQHLLGPALQGIYGAAPERLSAEAVFGARAKRRGGMAAPPGGMGELIARLHDALVRKGVTFTFGTRLDRLDPATPTVVCTNVAEAARLVAPHASALGDALAATPMTSLLTATAFFAPHRDDLSGFGVLFPRDSGVRALGCLFNASIFDGRSAVRSETWIFSGEQDGTGLPAENGVVTQILADRERLTGRSDAPLDVVVTRRVPALPVYDTSILAIRRHLPDLPPWLRLAGNYTGQIGVAALLARAEDIGSSGHLDIGSSGARTGIEMIR
ncbi:MAG TPA: FAD-dependent oxidoreductase [Vicinamibacterales bacterium]|nr:FAD-dependent oxidoreductase [Vicinamibacterales bacterium]